ncbi:hypothetical protein ACRXCV_00260 (plasmid) [Halobacteriovorax sp. GFR7]|uniref:hypothetical protein n=1 Tax=unclassified Halobacteriovorax TaxID=2639665 RepID=UPI003D95543D
MGLTTKQIRRMVAHITYKEGWDIIVGEDGARTYLQLSVTGGVCSVTKQPADWKGGKKYLSQYMCKQEIIGACFAIIKEAEEHETREWFRYKGAAIFNPHLDPDALVRVARDKTNFCTRPDNQSMTQEEPE